MHLFSLCFVTCNPRHNVLYPAPYNISNAVRLHVVNVKFILPNVGPSESGGAEGIDLVITEYVLQNRYISQL